MKILDDIWYLHSSVAQLSHLKSVNMWNVNEGKHFITQIVQNFRVNCSKSRSVSRNRIKTFGSSSSGKRSTTLLNGKIKITKAAISVILFKTF